MSNKKLKIGDVFRAMLKVVSELVEGYIKLETQKEVKITSKELDRLGVEIIIRKKR
jgi:methyltransferase-like protein